MHGTYEHRITCNLHSHQYHPLVHAAQGVNMPTALFVRDAALAYIQKKTVLPLGLDERLKSKQQEMQNAAMYLEPIIKQADASKRLTPRDIKRAAKIAIHLGHQINDLFELVSLIPHDH